MNNIADNAIFNGITDLASKYKDDMTIPSSVLIEQLKDGFKSEELQAIFCDSVRQNKNMIRKGIRKLWDIFQT